MTAGRKDNVALAGHGTLAKLPDNLGDFLFAEVGAGPGGMPVTALSVLARLGLDPWDEAGRLSRLPDPDATRELAHRLAAGPGVPAPDPDGCARRLVALLPGRAAPPASAPAQPGDTSLGAARRRAAMLALAGMITGLSMLLAGHLAATGGSATASKPQSVVLGRP